MEEAGTSNGVPKSFVIKHGPVGHSLAQLVHDLRKVMEPNTASRLRVRLVCFIILKSFLILVSEGTHTE